jgi:hypothetical protein
MGRTRNKYGGRRGPFMILVGKPEGKSLLGRHRGKWEDNIKIEFQKVDWIVLAQNRDGWRAVVNAIMNFWVT